MLRSFLKWLGFSMHEHEWSKWETQGPIVMGKEQRQVGYWQTRQCASCGDVELKKVW